MSGTMLRPSMVDAMADVLLAGYAYGVRPSRTHTLEDQLGLVPGTKSKIEDGSDTGTSGGEVVTVADFR